MPENENADHWGLLGAKLGAEAASEEPKAAEEQMSPPPVDVAPPPPKAPAAPRPARPRKSTSDWNRLAESLGVDVPPAPPEELPATPPPPEVQEPVVAREITRPEV